MVEAAGELCKIFDWGTVGFTAFGVTLDTSALIDDDSDVAGLMAAEIVMDVKPLPEDETLAASVLAKVIGLPATKDGVEAISPPGLEIGMLTADGEKAALAVVIVMRLSVEED